MALAAGTTVINVEDYKARLQAGRPSLVDGLGHGLWDIAGLAVWNILLAGLAFSAFLRTDVR